uniref:Terpene synthase n=1 Tax=Psidium guajava TaxID=120290 RepID=A0AA95ZAF0_PSIGU|nr:terpene synthase [Psidium guajava]
MGFYGIDPPTVAKMLSLEVVTGGEAVVRGNGDCTVAGGNDDLMVVMVLAQRIGKQYADGNFIIASLENNSPSLLLLFPLGRLFRRSTAKCALNIEGQDITTRSANWKPSVWDSGYVQLLDADFAEEVQGLFHRERNQVAKLEFIDTVQRLGLGYHFKTEIKNTLGSIYNNTEDTQLSDNLYAASLRFRLLRQHGYNVPQDVLQRFINKKGSFSELLKKDVKGLLGLYEASFHGLEGETIVDEVWYFASKHLKDLNLNKRHELEARWFMDMYEKQQDMIPSLLRLAKLDFNLVQSIHKKEVSNMARWWAELGANKMALCRDRLVEYYFWCCVMVFEPQYTDFREMTTKLVSMITLIDDVYDAYGTLEELELLTDFIVRWDITYIDKLPLTIRAYFLALYNTTNEIGYWTMRERGINPIPYMRKVWADECKAYIKEARWHNMGIKPTLEEYVDNAVDSVGGVIVLLGSYFLTTDELTEEGLDYVSKIPSLHELARGDNVKALECYMNETGASEEAAREHVRHLMRETWTTMNRDVFEDCPYPGFGPFRSACFNMARASQCFYHCGDEHGLSEHETGIHIVLALFEPVPLD